MKNEFLDRQRFISSYDTLRSKRQLFYSPSAFQALGSDLEEQYLFLIDIDFESMILS